MKFHPFFIYLIGIWIPFIVGCEGKVASRQYTEILTQGESQSSMAGAGQKQNILLEKVSWAVPEGWIKTPGSGTRLATFSFAKGGKSAQCAITQFPGKAGGIDENIRRWMGQLDLIPFTILEMENFIQRMEKWKIAGGVEGMLVDLTTILSGNIAEDGSTMAAIYYLPNSTVFLKFSGHKSILREERESFSQLARSLEVRS